MFDVSLKIIPKAGQNKDFFCSLSMQILEMLSLYVKITPQESYFSILHISQDNSVIILQRRQMQILKCSPSAQGF